MQELPSRNLPKRQSSANAVYISMCCTPILCSSLPLRYGGRVSSCRESGPGMSGELPVWDILCTLPYVDHPSTGKASTPAFTRCSICHQPLFVGTIFLFLSITAHWLLTNIRLFQALIFFQGGAKPVLFLGDLSQATNIAQTATLILSGSIFDAMMIYRVWVVWAHTKYVVIFPTLCWIAYAVCGIIMIYRFSLYKLGTDVFDTPTGQWVTALCILTICTSVYSTFMITLRIWQTSHRLEIFGDDPIMRAIAVFSESAALYATWTIFFFATYEAGSNLQNIANATCPAMAGIAATLINVRVGLGWAFGSAPHSPARTDTTLSFVVPSRREFCSRELSTRPVEVHISQASDRSDENGSDKGAMKRYVPLQTRT
ncbi:uncharacterized protein B0H18DRAFT_451217 [Fomitopsis serialis]|uniref:uncharacterized protein n=1 Tax=Fomitopsis serialis TaxID=139415 RepID=UPI0020087A95|nr:uncharacterized protein B0H18DRAFT_451217 [Neoantrodia serialis]KAH9923876.1 hypothetical protein B0H18DRAFT_451217 [Neoantrodia serialis]